MGRSAWGIVGGVVGAFFGAPQLGYMVGNVVGGIAEGPTRVQGPRIGETGAQTSAEGAPRGIVYGTVDVTGNVMACGPLIKADVETEQGKGGGTITSTEHCYRTFAIRICEGPIGGVTRIWEDEKLVYDVRPGSLMIAESQQWLFGSGIYLGTEDQLPDFFLDYNIPVPGGHPAYRGTAYMVRVFVDLTDRRGSIPQYRFEVAGSTTATEVIGPLIVNDWTTGRPEHLQGDTLFRLTSGIDDGYTSFTEAAAAQVAANIGSTPSASDATTFIAFDTNTNDTCNVFDGGATIADNPQIVVYRLAAREPDVWLQDFADYGSFVCGMFANEGTVVDDGLLYGMDPGGASDIVLSKLVHYESSPTGPYSYFFNNCTNYPTIGGNFPQARGTPNLKLWVTRIPSPPVGFETVVGTAKQLCAVEYRDGVLFQNALGPVLLPGDSNYDDSAFWEDARDAAVLEGTMDPDVVVYPVVVSSYASGTSTLAGLPVSLGIIVSDLHDRCSVPASKYDVSDLSDMVAGLLLAGDYTGADAINTLRVPYFFDKSEHDKKLWYPKRGAAVVTTLTIDDLVEEPDDSLRQQAIEYPKKSHLFYKHAASGYKVPKATSTRSSPDARVVGEISVQVPVVLNEDQAAQMAAKLHKVAWAEADGEVTLSVPESFIKYTPSDPIGLSLRGRVNRLRIESAEHADGVISWKLRRDRQSAYTSSRTGVPIPDPTPPPPTIVGQTAFAFMDIGSRADSEDDLHYLVAGSGGMPAWYGWTLQRSLDAGANYTKVASSNTAAVMGSLLDAITVASEFYTDTTNVVRVQLYRDTQTIDSLTDAQFLSEGGAFALAKPDGSYEVMQYLDATDEGDGIFALTMLHRGQLNSGSSSHSVGAIFVMLSRAQHIPAQSGWIGQNLTHRPLSFDQLPEDATPQTNTYFGRSQLEWTVASLSLARDVSDIVAGSWAPRHRFGTDDAPVASTNFQGYRIALDDGVLPVVTFDSATASFAYDASALGAPLTVRVSALNRITGAGPATSGSI
ncbi:phage tail protein [Variovorax sp. RT4R15]|uniref:phage tail protein n=1 Tax=Variovorax sp. RT4R15 TaxID=3443737 RepID=UPI003F47115E